MKKGHWLAFGFLLGLLASGLLILILRSSPYKPLELTLPTQDLPPASGAVLQFAQPAPGNTSEPVREFPALKLNLNTATRGQLISLPGIGEAKADAILAWRAANGAFTSLEDLLDVPGIGPGILEELKPFLMLEP